MHDTLQQRLRRFNAKERGALVNRILGNEHIQPAPQFMSEVADHFAIERSPTDVFWAMDFHLDWLYAALVSPPPGLPIELNASLPGTGAVTGSGEDIDFLLCFSEDGGHGSRSATTHLILIEAKGVTNWDTNQLQSKYQRFLHMRPAIEAQTDVRTRLLLMSPVNPRLENRQNHALRKVIGELDELFGAVGWIQMNMSGPFDRVVRCDSRGRPIRHDPSHWKVEQR